MCVPKATVRFSDWLERQSSDQLLVKRVVRVTAATGQNRVSTGQRPGRGRARLVLAVTCSPRPSPAAPGLIGVGWVGVGARVAGLSYLAVPRRSP